MRLRKILFSFLILLLALSCYNDFDDSIQPIEEDNEQVPTAELIAEDSELFAMLETLTQKLGVNASEDVCIDFLYPFVIKVYDDEGYLQYSKIVEHDGDFVLLLSEIPEEWHINLSFPILTELPDGSPYEIGTKEELKVIIEDCIVAYQDEAIGFCQNLTAKCAWVVDYPESVDPDLYQNSVFFEPSVGLNSYYFRGNAYSSTWIFYFISNDLHLNISMENEEVGKNWNYDWELEAVTDSTMVIKNLEGQQYLLKKKCKKEDYCTTLTFSECELENEPGVAEFTLENYINCIEIIAEPLDENGQINTDVDYLYTFHPTEEDAFANENEIDATTPFINTEDPHVLYVRIEHPDTEEYIVTAIFLVTKECD